VLFCCFGSPLLAAENELFEQHDFVTRSSERQTVLAGYLLNGPVAEIATISVNANDERRMAIYTFVGSAWARDRNVVLPAGVLFVDIAHIGGIDRLLTYEPGVLNWFDPESGTSHTLLTAASNFKPPREDEVPHVDVTHDLNNDDRDDLVIPDVDGFWASIQHSNGEFADPVKIGHTTNLARIYGADGYRYDPWSQSRVHQIDANRDGRIDLVFWQGDRFEVQHQDANGLFVWTSTSVTTDVAFDSDNLDSLATGNMTGKALHSVNDLNGHGAADLVVFSLDGKKTKSKRSAYEIHFGSPAPNGELVWAPTPNIAIQSKDNIQLSLDTHDFNQDGTLDLMITTIDKRFLEHSLWKVLNGYMGDDIWLSLDFHLTKGGVIADTPGATRRIQLHDTGSIREPGWVPLDVVLRGVLHESRKTATRHGCIQHDERCSPHEGTFNAPLLVGDVTGDAHPDLLIGTTPQWLDVFVGETGNDIFAREPIPLRVDLPKDREYMWLFDLNRDGAQDIVMHRPSSSTPHTVVTLFAR